MHHPASRIASSDRSGRSARAGAARVALVEDQVEDSQDVAQPAAGRSCTAGRLNGTPDASIRRFARVIRCAIVASSTRKARAISAVVSPPTARSVSAIADVSVSAGWQHMKSTVSVSSSPASRLARAARRAASSSRRPATAHSAAGRAAAAPPSASSQPRGFSGTPSRGQRSAAAITPPAPRPPRRRSRPAGGPARQGPAAPAGAAGPRQRRDARAAGGRLEVFVHLGSVRRPSSITCRTWIGCCIGLPPAPGTAESLPRSRWPSPRSRPRRS